MAEWSRIEALASFCLRTSRERPGSNPVAAHTGRPHSLCWAALDTGCSTLPYLPYLQCLCQLSSLLSVGWRNEYTSCRVWQWHQTVISFKPENFNEAIHVCSTLQYLSFHIQLDVCKPAGSKSKKTEFLLAAGHSNFQNILVIRSAYF